MNESTTILHPPWLNLARAAWILCAVVTAFLFVVGGINFFRDVFLPCTTPDAVCGPWQVSAEDMALAQQLGMPFALMQFVYIFNGVFPKLVFYVMGVLIFWRRSDDWVALLLSVMLVGFALEGIVLSGTLALLQAILYVAITIIFLALPFIFPNGRWIPRWTLWFAAPIIFFGALGGLIPVVAPFLNQDVYAFALLLPFLMWFLLGGYAAVYRYRRVSSARERQQTKWVMAGVLGTFVIFIPFTIIAIFFPPSQPSAERLAVLYLFYIPIGFLSYIFIPVSIAISILRYRLWDIDILIRRTVTYALVVALLGVVYFGSVILLQRIFAGIIGDNSEIVTVLSTLAIAALFVPLRNRVQNAVDRRFNRKKYNAQQVLQKFAETVRDETDLEKLSGELANVVQETMQPKRVSVWLKQTTDPSTDSGQARR